MLWLALISGPVALALDLQGGYALVKWACASRQTWVLAAIALASCALALLGVWTGLRCVRAEHRAFLANVAIGLNLLIVIFILGSGFPILVLSPCE